MSQRRVFTDYEKKTVYAKCNGKCCICGKKIDFLDMTIDHKIPLSKGGTNEMSNLQLSCEPCNRIKNSMTMPELAEKITEILRNYKKMKIVKMLRGV